MTVVMTEPTDKRGQPRPPTKIPSRSLPFTIRLHFSIPYGWLRSGRAGKPASRKPVSPPLTPPDGLGSQAQGFAWLEPTACEVEFVRVKSALR